MVSAPGACWLWTAKVNTYGYGMFWLKYMGCNVGAHRVSYALAGKTIPRRWHIDHLCRVTACVNPAHLEAVPSRVNTLRGIGPSAVNAKKQWCRRGHSLVGSNVRFKRQGRERICRLCQIEQAKARFALFKKLHSAPRDAHWQRKKLAECAECASFVEAARAGFAS